MDDALLRKFVASRDQEAFAALMGRHLDWVYGAALRQVGDRHLADDIAQAVFVLLSRKAAGMKAGTRLTGWLFQALRYAAMNARTIRRRRLRHEQLAAGDERYERAHDWWERVGPVLDDSVARLSRADRELVLARFYENRSYEEIARGSGVSADGVRKRLARAVVEMRESLGSRAGELPEEFDGLLAGKMASVAPAGLAGTIAASVAGGGASATVTTLAGKVGKAFWMAKMKVMAVVTAGVVVAGGIGVAGVEMAKEPAGKVATTSPVNMPAPAAKAEDAAALPKVVSKAGREDAVYVAYMVLADELAMEDLRKLGTPVEGGGSGYELLSADGEALRRVLKVNEGTGVVASSQGLAVRRDWQREQWDDYSYRSLALTESAQLPGGQGLYRLDGRANWSARMSGGRVQLLIDQRLAGVTYRQGAAAPNAAAAQAVRAQTTMATNMSTVLAVRMAPSATEQWYTVFVVQPYGADVADTTAMTAAASSLAVSEWLAMDGRKWLMDSRRSVLWQQRLTAVDDAKWVRKLSDGSELRLATLSDDRVSPGLEWSAGGGATMKRDRSEYRPHRDLRAVVIGALRAVGTFTIRDGTASLKVGVGEGEFTQLGVLEMKDGATVTADGRRYWLRAQSDDVFEAHFENDPAIDVVFRPLRANGESSGVVLTPRIWSWEERTAREGVFGMIVADSVTKKVGVSTRRRVWHTFEGFAARPAVAGPDDAAVLASFAQPLAAPVGNSGSRSPLEIFATARARSISMEVSSEGKVYRWVGDLSGRYCTESGNTKEICDGERCLFYVSGTPFISRRGLAPASDDRLVRVDTAQSILASAEQLAGVTPVGQEMVDGVSTAISEGRSMEMGNHVVKVWRDGQNRVMKLQVERLGTVSVRYDSPEDAMRLVIPDADVAKAQDADRALPVLEKMTSRPAVFERTDVDRTLRMHEVVAGENGEVYVGYSVQLTPAVAKVLRFAPAGGRWGRGYIDAGSSSADRQYNATVVAFVHERDRSLWWTVLTPAAAGAEKPWYLRFVMESSVMPSATSQLRDAGLLGFGMMRVPLPMVDTSKPMSLDAWLKQVYEQVGTYTKVAPFQHFMTVQPISGTVDAFVQSSRQAVERGRAGASQGVTPD